MNEMLQGFLMVVMTMVLFGGLIIVLINSPPPISLSGFIEDVDMCALAGGTYESCFSNFRGVTD